MCQCVCFDWDLVISFSPCGVLKLCVCCMPFSSQGVCACVWVGGIVFVWCLVKYIIFVPRLCFVFPEGVTAFKGLITPGRLVCNRLSEA